MDGSRVIFMLMLIVMPLLLSAGIALPYLADSRSGRKDRDMHTTLAPGKEAGRGGRRCRCLTGRDCARALPRR